MIRWTIKHARYDTSITVDGPTNKAERNHLRAALRAGERQRMAGRNE